MPYLYMGIHKHCELYLLLNGIYRCGKYTVLNRKSTFHGAGVVVMILLSKIKRIKVIPYFEKVNVGYLRLIFEPREDIWWVRITRFS